MADATLETDFVRLVMALRRLGITQTRLLHAVENLPRRAFLPPDAEALAFKDEPAPISCGQEASAIHWVAGIVQALGLQPDMRVLEIGTGSGYQAALMAGLARRVHTIERHRDLALDAGKRFERLGIGNIVVRVGDGAEGWSEQAPFDRIVVNAVLPSEPFHLGEQLKPGGILIAAVGAPARLMRVARGADGLEGDALPVTSPLRLGPLERGSAWKA